MLTIKNQPKSLWILSFSNLVDTFSYYGTQTILALYLIHIFHLSIMQSYTIYGGYAAFVYSMPIFGGYIADKYLGSHKALIVGGILSITGNLLLIILSKYWFSLGLATTLIGMGLYKSTTTNLVGTLYSEKSKKEVGYTWLYLSCNVGGTLAPLVYGLIAYNLGWNYGFLCSALGVFISFLWFLSNKNLIKNIEPTRSLDNLGKLGLYSGIILLCFFLSLPFCYTVLIDPLIILFLAIGLTYLISLACTYKGQERKQVLALLTMNFFSMFYLAAGMQIGITLATFIQEKIQAGIIDIHLPASVFGMFYALFVLLLAPLITWFWMKLNNKGISINAPSKLVLGIFLSASGIFVFAIATLTHWLIACIVLGILFLSAGELVLSPSMYAAISNNAPKEIKSVMIGSWFLFLAFGGYLSAILAKASSYFTMHYITNSQYPDYFWQFLFIGSFITLAGACLVLFIPRLNKILI